MNKRRRVSAAVTACFLALDMGVLVAKALDTPSGPRIVRVDRLAHAAPTHDMDALLSVREL